MGKKISNFLKGEIVSSVFYIAFGLCLILIPDQTVNIICKVIFGLVMIAVGIYHIAIYAAEKEKATILDLFTGVIVLVLGVFLFFTPQIVVKILPYLLGAFVLVDSIWKLKGSIRLKKMEQGQWKVLLAGSIIFIILSCSVLAFEQLSAIDKNQKNYAVIDRLGVPGRRQASLIRRELSTVFLIPLLFPLLLTVLLIAGAQFFFGEAILQQGLVPLYGLVTILLFCAIYLTYFGATMFLFKRVILRPEMR